MRGPTPIDIAPREGARLEVDRRAGSGDVRRRGHAAMQCGEGASPEAAFVKQAAGEVRASTGADAGSVGAVAGLDVSARLAELTTLGMPALRSEWRRLFRREAPRLSRDQMMRAIAYRIQETAFGGLPIAVERRLAKLTDTFESRGRIVAPPTPKVKLGARLVREWRGRTHVAAVVDGGFEYEGKTFPSLTAIAVEITGAHWSGPRFFGLVRRRRAKKVGASEDETDGESDEVQLSMSGCSPAAGRPRDDAAELRLANMASYVEEKMFDA
jgi:Protein of unknown function (DUF2924)